MSMIIKWEGCRWHRHKIEIFWAQNTNFLQIKYTELGDEWYKCGEFYVFFSGVDKQSEIHMGETYTGNLL